MEFELLLSASPNWAEPSTGRSKEFHTSARHNVDKTNRLELSISPGSMIYSMDGIIPLVCLPAYRNQHMIDKDWTLTGPDRKINRPMS